MKSISLLISPRVKSAYFNEYIEVCKAELGLFITNQEIVYTKIADMDFFEIEASYELLEKLATLSFVYGFFERQNGHLLPLSVSNSFNLHEDFVFGSKYKGKTSEILTQMLINIGLQSIKYDSISDVKLLDPMCGRGTTLLWGMRYGMKTKGIEQDPKALDDIRQSVKKWSKIHRQKHNFVEGFTGGKNKENIGKFIDFSVKDTSMKVIIGDSVNANTILKKEKFNLIVSDLPYGIHHFTTNKTRNPLAILKDCAHGWSDSLKTNGVMVLAFNNYMPKRKELIEVFINHKMQVMDFCVPHRMSESIVRDVLVFKKIS